MAAADPRGPDGDGDFGVQPGSVTGGGHHHGARMQRTHAPRSRIAILTVFIQPQAQHRVIHAGPQVIPDFVLENFGNKFRYAGMHGYDFLPIMWNFADPDLPPSWAKVMAAKRYLHWYDWVWLADLDLFVTNKHLTIQDHVLGSVGRDKHLVAAKDCNGFNMGSFLLRSSSATMRFLDAVHALRHNTTLRNYHEWWEQAASMYVLDHDPEAMAMMEVIPQRLFNSYRFDCGHQWKLSDFAVHFPGMAMTAKAAGWQEVLLEGGAELQELLP